MVCEDCEQLKARIAELEMRLARYENAHTPPSLRDGLLRKKQEQVADKKPGQKKGHLGAFRAMPQPTCSIEVVTEQCPHCSAQLGKPFKVETRVIEDVPEPQPVEVIEYRIGHYHCTDCGKNVVAEHTDLPRSGRFGTNVVAHASLLKYEERLPHRKICAVLQRQHGLSITPASVLDFTRRASDAVQDEYHAILARVRNAKVVYADETSIKVQGKKYWVWVFTTYQETFIVIRNSRGLKVLKEVLDKEFNGVIVCDGWKSYANFTMKLQRCWAHLKREAKFVAEHATEAIPLLKALERLYHKLTTALAKDPPPAERARLFRNATATLTRWLNKPWKEERVQKFVKKIRNGIKHWFTFVLVPGVEPTNNRAERALREHVVQRKIIGTLRNKKGTRIHQTLMSVIATWKQQGINPYTKLRQSLS